MQGQLRVGVPEALPGSTCSSFHVDISQAMCNRYSDKRISYSLRYDDGNYPYGYYHFHHMFKPLGVQGLVIASRTANMVIALALLGSIGCWRRLNCVRLTCWPWGRPGCLSASIS